MLRHAQASVAAYSFCGSVKVSASQLERRWLFRNLFPEEDGVYLLQAFVLDAESADIFLQFDAGMLFEGRAFVQHHEVIPQGKAYFRYTRVSSNVITGRVSPVRLRRNRKQCSSEEICSRATLCICLCERRTGFAVYAQQRAGLR